jgi:hypothetical protein
VIKSPKLKRRRLAMSRRTAVILGVLVVAAALGLEWTIRYGPSSRGCALVVNEGAEPIEGLIVSYAGTSASLGSLAPGEKTKAWFTGSGRGMLTLQYTQKGNALSGFKVDDFNPTELRRDGSRMVLVIQTNRVQRFVEEDDTNPSPPRMLDRLMDWIRDGLR